MLEKIRKETAKNLSEALVMLYDINKCMSEPLDVDKKVPMDVLEQASDCFRQSDLIKKSVSESHKTIGGKENEFITKK